jgi:hypothetical protein
MNGLRLAENGTAYDAEALKHLQTTDYTILMSISNVLPAARKVPTSFFTPRKVLKVRVFV